MKNINNEIFLKGITKSGKFVLYDEKYCEEFIEKSQMGIKIGDMVICNNDKIPEVDRIFSVDKMSRSFDGDINLHGISKSGKSVSYYEFSCEKYINSIYGGNNYDNYNNYLKYKSKYLKLKKQLV